MNSIPESIVEWVVTITGASRLSNVKYLIIPTADWLISIKQPAEPTHQSLTAIHNNTFVHDLKLLNHNRNFDP
jgi:hypothetical protein